MGTVRLTAVYFTRTAPATAVRSAEDDAVTLRDTVMLSLWFGLKDGVLPASIMSCRDVERQLSLWLRFPKMASVWVLSKYHGVAPPFFPCFERKASGHGLIRGIIELWYSRGRLRNASRCR
jgi:hypothetical protein